MADPAPRAAARPDPRTAPAAGYWICQFAGWGLYSLMKFYAAVTLLGMAWSRALLELLLLGGVGLLLSHALHGYVQRRRWSALRLRALLWRCLAAALVVGAPLGLLTQFTQVAALNTLDPLLQEYSLSPRSAPAIWLGLAVQIANGTVLFVLWLAIYFAVIAVRQHRSAELRQSELTRALQAAELRLLKTQLNPHFLFNALNTVRSLIAEDPARAQGAVTRLANTLRYALRSGQSELVSLAQELATVQDYLELESLRFEHRLQVQYAVDADTGELQMPVMLLQTVVENAIKHGIAQLPAGGLLRIAAARQDDELHVTVQNPRPAQAASGSGAGVGLHNAQERLRLLFGARASLQLDLSQPALAVARIRLPAA